MSSTSHRLLTWANLLTAARVVMIAPLAYAVLQQHWPWAAVLFTAGAITDFYDGKVARALDQTSPWGRLVRSCKRRVTGIRGLRGAGRARSHQSLSALADRSGVHPVYARFESAGRPGTAHQRHRPQQWGRLLRSAGTGIGASLLHLELIIQFLPAAAWLLTASTIASMVDRGLALLRR